MALYDMSPEHYAGYAKSFNRGHQGKPDAAFMFTMDETRKAGELDIRCQVLYNVACWKGVDGFYVQALQLVAGYEPHLGYQERNVRDYFVTSEDYDIIMLREFCHYLRGEITMIRPEDIRAGAWRSYTDTTTQTF